MPIVLSSDDHSDFGDIQVRSHFGPRNKLLLVLPLKQGDLPRQTIIL